jgi:hypothetical protein
MILGATITGSLILNGVNLSSITGSEASINALNSFTASAATTGSNVFKSNQTVTGSVDITGSLTVVGPITGTVTTASYVLNAVSASYALNATTASYALVATSSSFAANSDLLDGRDSLTFANTGSNAFVGTQNINGSVAITGSLVTTGAITAQTLNVQQVTSSIVYSSGSNIFGNSVSNTQSMTGSVGISGSLSVNGISTLTGALSGTSATFSGDLTVDTNTLYVDSTNNRVGIGTTSPNKKLEVITGNGTTDGIRLTYVGGSTTEGLDITYLNTGQTTTSFDSLYNSDTAVMRFRMKTAATAVTALSILGTGAATFSSSISVLATGITVTIDDAGKAGYTITNSAAVRTYKMIAGIDGTSNTGFSIRNVTAGRNELLFTDGGAATFSSSVTTGATSTLKATGNSFTNGSLILKNSDGTTNTYLTNAGGGFYLSNDGTNSVLSIASTGEATFSAGITGTSARFNNSSGAGNFILLNDGNTAFGAALGLGSSGDFVISSIASSTLTERFRIARTGGAATFSSSIAATSATFTGDVAIGSYSQARHLDLFITAPLDGKIYWGSTDSPRQSFFGSTGTPNLTAQCGGSGGVQLTSGATSWSSLSDERLKNVNSNIDFAIDKLMTLNAINFSWKYDDTNKENIGLIAQEIEKVFPQVIDKSKLPSKDDQENIDETEYLSVRYTELIPILVKAIQELNAKITELENK